MTKGMSLRVRKRNELAVNTFVIKNKIEIKEEWL